MSSAERQRVFTDSEVEQVRRLLISIFEDSIFSRENIVFLTEAINNTRRAMEQDERKLTELIQRAGQIQFLNKQPGEIKSNFLAKFFPEKWIYWQELRDTLFQTEEEFIAFTEREAPQSIKDFILHFRQMFHTVFSFFRQLF